MDERTLARFISKVRVLDNGCWEWTGAVNESGYGVFTIEGGKQLAHRVSYKHFVEPIPDGLELDHLCHTRDLSCPGGDGDPHRRCVCWADLEPVTGLENSRRAAERITHCPKDHEYTPANTYITRDGGRECRTCRHDRSREWMRIHNPGVRHGTETHCPQSHPYSGDNLIITVTGGRACRECKRAWNREYARNKRAAAKAARATSQATH